jgi:hypothetical protein
MIHYMCAKKRGRKRDKKSWPSVSCWACSISEWRLLTCAYLTENGKPCVGKLLENRKKNYFCSFLRAQPTPARSAGRRRSLQQVLDVAHDNTHCSSYAYKKCYRDLRLLEILDGFSSLMARSTRLDEGNGPSRKRKRSDANRKRGGEKPQKGAPKIRGTLAAKSRI